MREKDDSFSRRKRSCCEAFTIIELLVGITIIGILMGLLLPAVQSAREAMRRSNCMNNLRQCALGVQVFESIRGRYPSGTEGNGLSPLFAISPHLDLGGIYLTMDENVSPFDPPNDFAATVQVPLFVCPTDCFVGREEGLGWSNYHCNAGSWAYIEEKWDGFFGCSVDYTINGKVIPAMKVVKSSTITDGLSNTVMMTEVVNGAGNGEGPKTKDDCLETYMIPDTVRTVEDAQRFYLSTDMASSTIPFNGNWRWRGYPWTAGSISRTWYNHLLPPNEPCWVPKSDFNLIVSTASSFHVSGVNTAFGDGSCRFVSENVDNMVWLNLGRISDGQAFEVP